MNPRMITGLNYYRVNKYRNGKLFKISWYTEVSEKETTNCLICHSEVKQINVAQVSDIRPARIFSAKKRPASGVKKREVRIQSAMPV